MRYTVFLILACFTLSSNAGEIIMDADKLREIFTDKTAHGKHLKRDEPPYEVYFAPDGSLARVTEMGEKHTGKWSITDDAKHCVSWDHKGGNSCNNIRAGNDEGVYFRIRIISANKTPKRVKLTNFRDGNQLPK